MLIQSFMLEQKYIEVDYHFVQERVASKLLEIKLISSADQIANGFTKPLSIQILEQIRSNLDLGKLRLRGHVNRKCLFP